MTRGAPKFAAFGEWMNILEKIFSEFSYLQDLVFGRQKDQEACRYTGDGVLHKVLVETAIIQLNGGNTSPYCGKNFSEEI